MQHRPALSKRWDPSGVATAPGVAPPLAYSSDGLAAGKSQYALQGQRSQDAQSGCTVRMHVWVCEGSNRWLVAWAFGECVLISASMLWLQAFTVS